MHSTSVHSALFDHKSTTEEIRARFDQDVERFSNLQTGQQATIDAPLVLELVAQAGRGHLQPQDTILDLGCGAGNFTLRVLQETPGLHCHLVDLSRPMLDRAESRVRAGGAASVAIQQSDLRALTFAEGTFNAILAGAVLHHLRDEVDWAAAFRQFYTWLKPGGRLYVADLVTFDIPEVQDLMWRRYGDYLTSLGGVEYRDKVFAYIELEDSPRSLPFQLELLRTTGFSQFDVLHRNSVFASYVARK